MRLYSGTSQQFVEDNFQNQIAEKLKLAFFENFRFNPSPNEVGSWRNSLRAMSQVIEHSKLLDQGVLLEYQLPLSSRRLDCIICGEDAGTADNAVIVELKQWEKCKDSTGDREVSTWVGGANRDVLHPSAQVGQYKHYLQDAHTAFYEGSNPVVLNGCSYLHNYNYYKEDILFSPKFNEIVGECPLFTADDVMRLSAYLKERVGRGNGQRVLGRLEQSKYRPSRKLMDHVGQMIKGNSEYVLLDEQLVVYDQIVSLTKQSFHDKQKAVVIVEGGPGTGKSVIAINLMADLSLAGYNAQYATGSKAFTETLRKKTGSRAAIQFKYFNSYADAEDNAVDVLIADESHRIRKTSYNRFTPRLERTEAPQIEELISAAKVVVFFIDDKQIVRPDEIGSVQYIRDYAEKRGCKVLQYKLEAQFRCSGSDGFVNWVNNTLGIEKTANVLWQGNENFDFRIMTSPEELERAIRSKVQEGNTGRLMAGFCWKWSDPNEDGTLRDDVVIADYQRPWNAKPDAKHLAPGIPKSTLWASDPNGIDQIGCIYTAQGFEFDYAGVIFGEDLTYDFSSQSWEGHLGSSADKAVKRSIEDFVDLVKNTYRVLLSRGMKGCYVYFVNKDTENFVKSRIETGRKTMGA
jgi:DUF2075 family protein